jgi:hypothetical protein
MTPDEAIAFVANVASSLPQARPGSSSTEAIVNRPIKGSWWGHPKSHQIYAILQAVADSSDILVCRLVDGKVTFVHRRLWPALVRLAKRFPPDRIAQVREEHTPAGRHVNREMPFPEWVPADVQSRAANISEADAIAAMGALVIASAATPARSRRKPNAP